MSGFRNKKGSFSALAARIKSYLSDRWMRQEAMYGIALEAPPCETEGFQETHRSRKALSFRTTFKCMWHFDLTIENYEDGLKRILEKWWENWMGSVENGGVWRIELDRYEVILITEPSTIIGEADFKTTKMEVGFSIIDTREE